MKEKVEEGEGKQIMIKQQSKKIFFIVFLYSIIIFSINVKAKQNEIIIKSQPVSVSAKEKEHIEYTVQAKGKKLKYQWQVKKGKNQKWKNLKGKTTSTLSLVTSKKMNRYYYRCLISDAFGNKRTTKSAKLTISEIFIETQPESIITRHTGHIEYTVQAKGEKLKYQWQIKKGKGQAWKNLKGKTTSTLSLVASRKMDGYYYRCLISDAFGNKRTTKSAKLTISDKNKYYASQANQSELRGFYQRKVMDNYCYVYAYRSKYTEEIKQAIAKINNACGRLFIYTTDPEISDIVILDYKNCGYAVSNAYLTYEEIIHLNNPEADNCVGVTFSNDNTALHYLICLNDGLMKRHDIKNRISIIIHELGHCVNIGHSTSKNDIMYPTNFVSDLSENDIAKFKYARKIIRELAKKQ